MKAFLKITLVMVGIAAAFAASVQASNLASDNAAGYTSAIWTNGSNQGSGFGVWSFVDNGNPAQSGHFVFTSTSNAGGASGGIDTGGNSWGLYANTGATSAAIRPFTGGPLTLGQTFMVDIDQGYQDGGSIVGISLQNSTSNNLAEVYYVGGDSVNSWKKNDLAGQANLSPNVGFSGNGFHLEITLTGAASYSGTLTPLNPTGTPVSFSGSLLLPAGGQGIEQVRLFNFNAGSGGDNNAYFNNLLIVPEPSSIALVGVGLLGAWFIRRRKV